MSTGSAPVMVAAGKRAEEDEEDDRPEEQPDDEGGALDELAVDPAEHAADEPAGDAAHPRDPAVHEEQSEAASPISAPPRSDWR